MISQVTLGDCMEGMKQYPDKYFDLAVVDPPYGIGEDGLKNHSRGNLAKPTLYKDKDWDREIPSAEYFYHLKRVSKKQVIWGGNYFLDHLSSTSCFIVWDKDNTGDFADCELAWTNFDTAVRKFKFMWNGMLQGDMKNKETRIHPTQKPVKLYSWIYDKYLPNGGKVIDTHGGSMSNLIAAIKQGNIEMTVFEIDKDYFQSAKKRVQDFLLQGNMFTEGHEVIFFE